MAFFKKYFLAFLYFAVILLCYRPHTIDQTSKYLLNFKNLPIFAQILSIVLKNVDLKDKKK